MSKNRSFTLRSESDVYVDGQLLTLGFAVDEHGRSVKRTKFSHPYSYDGFVVWRGGPNEEANFTVYTDRLYRWSPNKHDELVQKHFGNRGQRWSERDPDAIEQLLRDWYGEHELKLVLIMEYCNQASGFPVWRFDVRTSDVRS